MSMIRIGDRLVGDGQPTYIIAEIGVNHNGFMDLALKLIDVAVDAGADAVKFQKRSLDKLYGKKYLENANAGEKTLRYLLPILQQVELSEEMYHDIVAYCKEKNITFLCSAFDMESADFLDKLGVPAYKVASADLTNLPLLDHLVQKGKPLILSTGMSHMSEVELTVEFLKERRASFALLHCNSTYPAAFEDINLRFMNQLRRFDVPVGYSGHERGIAVSTVASALGASIIERHLTLDRTMDGPDHAASLEPQGFKKMVRDIRQVTQALGTGEEKFISRGEILNREVLAKSLVAARRITSGETITPEMVAVKGPALGISPQRYTQLLGRVVERTIEEDEPFLDRDLGVTISLDVDNLLPMEYGFTVRFRDFQEMLVYKPHMLEFHFTDQDLDEHYPGYDYTENSAHPLKLVVHAPEFWDRTLVDICSLDERQRTASLKLLQKAIDLTREMSPYFIGVPKVVIHPGAMSLDHPITNRQALYDNLRRSVGELDYDGVELLLENLPPHPWYFGGQWLTNAFMDAYEIRDFIAPLGLNFCYDTSHHKLYCNWAHVDFFEQLRALLPYIRHLHLSDGAGLDGEGLQIGEGAIDWLQFFRVLGDYRGTMIPEIWRGHQRNGEGFLIAIQRLSQAYFAVANATPSAPAQHA
ncbi:MAG: N-acetylneuraminate synthase family protein [Anaerolineales bacterium]|nr:N-acetylneuraminate synthase family protein [Anaerolineales bacterium]